MCDGHPGAQALSASLTANSTRMHGMTHVDGAGGVSNPHRDSVARSRLDHRSTRERELVNTFGQ